MEGVKSQHHFIALATEHSASYATLQWKFSVPAKIILNGNTTKTYIFSIDCNDQNILVEKYYLT